MREKPGREDWQKLYDVMEEFYELEPWKRMDELNLFALVYEDQTVYVNVLGGDVEQPGFAAYEGRDGLMTYMMFRDSEVLNISDEFAVLSLSRIYCYFDEQETAGIEQKAAAEELGLKEDPAFGSVTTLKQGYMPVTPDKEEMQRFTRYMEDFITAYVEYCHHNVTVHFEDAECFAWHVKERKAEAMLLPVQGFEYEELDLQDREILDELLAIEQTKTRIEMGYAYLNVPITHTDAGELRDWFGNHIMVITADRDTGSPYGVVMAKSVEDLSFRLAEELIHYIYDWGRPAQVSAADEISRAALEGVCDQLNIDFVMRDLDQIPRLAVEFPDYLREDIQERTQS